MRSFLSCLSAILLAWAGCTAACLPTGSSNRVEIGQTTHVCLVLNDRHVQLASPDADTFLRFTLDDSFTKSKACESPFQNGGLNGSNSTDCSSQVYIESMGVKSIYKKEYLGSGTGRIFPTLTAVISVEQGEVKSVYWDDGCWFCPVDDSNEFQGCVQNAYSAGNELINYPSPGVGWECGLTSRACSELGDDQHCNMNLYVVWVGTDVNGRHFSSSGSRLERFSKYALSSMYTYLERTAKEVADVVKTTVGA